MSVITRTILLLTASNVFMTFAWYAHLRERPAVVHGRLSELGNRLL